MTMRVTRHETEEIYEVELENFHTVEEDWGHAQPVVLRPTGARIRVNVDHLGLDPEWKTDKAYDVQAWGLRVGDSRSDGRLINVRVDKALREEIVDLFLKEGPS